MRFLRLRAVAHNARPRHAQSHRRQAGGVSPGAFGGEDVTLHDAPAWPAMLLRPCRCRPPACMEYPLPCEAVFFVREDACGVSSGFAQICRERLLQKRAHLIAKRTVFRGEVEIHESRSATRCSKCWSGGENCQTV